MGAAIGRDLERPRLPGSRAYNARLQALTEQFVIANATRASRTAARLGQLRTNEIALAAPWELREFQLTQSPSPSSNETTVEDTSGGQLQQHPEPHAELTLLNWILTVKLC